MRVLLVCLLVCGAAAHELRPAYLDLREVERDVFTVVWKVPSTGPADLALRPDFGPGSEVIGTIAMSLPQGNLVRRWTQRMPALATAGIGFAERDGVAYDILIHRRSREGVDQVYRLPPGESRLMLPERPTALASLGVYTVIGIEHILIGLDHVLFVLGLLLLIRGTRMLLATITAFTLAHSVTLAATALDLVHPPMRPVEACIALSLVLLAVEAIRRGRGRSTWAAHHPWAIAFPFGLLHGFGFAGALAEVGLPRENLGFALLGFNLGVEIGQVAIISVGILTLRICGTLRRNLLTHSTPKSCSRWGLGRSPETTASSPAEPIMEPSVPAEPGCGRPHVSERLWTSVPAYTLGGVAACWVIGRMLG